MRKFLNKLIIKAMFIETLMKNLHIISRDDVNILNFSLITFSQNHKWKIYFKRSQIILTVKKIIIKYYVKKLREKNILDGT